MQDVIRTMPDESRSMLLGETLGAFRVQGLGLEV